MTILSVDAINMHPSVKLSIIKNAVRLFRIKLTTSTKKKINLCLELIRFGIISTLITYDGNYYKYHGREKYEQGLANDG